MAAKGYDFVDLNKLVRQNYNPESENGVNAQINMELSAMYTYLSMVRDYINLSFLSLSLVLLFRQI